MTQEEQEKTLLEKIKANVNEVIDSKSAHTASELKNIQEQIKKLVSDDVTPAMREELISIASDLKALKEQTAHKKEQADNFSNGFVSGYKSTLDKFGVDGMKQKGFSQSLEVKTAGAMLTSNIDAVGTNSIPYTLSDAAFGLVRTARRRPFIMDLCNVGFTNKMYVQWAEMASNDPGTAAMTAEGAAKTQEDFDISEKSAKVEKVAAYTKVSTEMLDDVDFIKAEIENNLMELIALKADSQILLGNGSTPNLNGIVTTATAYSAGSFADTILAANHFDVLLSAVTQVTVGNFNATNIVLNPVDFALMLSAKSSTAEYVHSQLFVLQNGSASFMGIPIVINNGVTAGSFLVGDFTKANVRVRKSATMSMGYDGSDFTLNLITILAEARLVVYVGVNNYGAFVYGTFSSAIEALELA